MSNLGQYVQEQCFHLLTLFNSFCAVIRLEVLASGQLILLEARPLVEVP